MATFHRRDEFYDLGASFCHGVGVSLCVAELSVGQRSLRNQRSQAVFVGFVGQVLKLFVEHPQFLAQRPQATRHLGQATLDKELSHAVSVGTAVGCGVGAPPRAVELRHAILSIGRQPHGVSMIDEWGITDGYSDTDGQWHATNPETRAALRAAMGELPDAPPMWFVTPGEPHRLQSTCDLLLEDGSSRMGLLELPVDIPIGYHDLVPQDGGPTTRVVVTPRTFRMPSRGWGLAAQLYSARSHSSWGIGDLADLQWLTRWTGRHGGNVVLVSPLHAVAVHRPRGDSADQPPVQASPYYSASRVWRNVLHLRIPRIDGAERLGPDISELDLAGRSLNAASTIERDSIASIKVRTLEAIYALGRHSPAFDEWRTEQGESLERFATWSAIAEEHGRDWAQWPVELRHPATASADPARVCFHAWCQWQLDCQLEAAACPGVDLVTDLAVGFDPAGADGWAHQELLATGCRVGAPPDTFNPFGQDWGLPPFVPTRLRAMRYQPFIDTIRASLRHAGGLRIDHVMGLFRQYWIAPGGGPDDGAYVRYPAGELLDLIAVEAHRAGAFVIGEDLGTVEPEVHTEMEARGMLSCRLLWFEDTAAAEFPWRAVASVTTHDLPTFVGMWTGADRAARAAIGLATIDDGDRLLRQRVRAHTGLDDGAPLDDVIVAAHRSLADTPCVLATVTTDDLFGAIRRPNLPGTIDSWPNWRIPLPRPIEDLDEDELALRIVDAISHTRRA